MSKHEPIQSPALAELLRQPGIWRAGRREVSPDILPSGFALLDRALPGGGWPGASLTEILAGEHGIGELRLLLPALARLSRDGRWVVWVAPPYLPYAPALAQRGLELSRVLLLRPQSAADALWSLEQALRCGICGAVLAWPDALDERALRRLQLAAQAGGSWGILFRDLHCAGDHSPAALRLILAPAARGVTARIIKCRGRGPSTPLVIDPDATTSGLSSLGRQAVCHKPATGEA